MGNWKASGEIIIGGIKFQTDAKVVNFSEGPKWDATSERCIPTENERMPPCHDLGNGTWAPYKGDGGRMFSRRYQVRPKVQDRSYKTAKQVIRQFMIHHDGCATSDMCFGVLQNERGLSCHFLVDNDGTIYQTLDLALEGWHGSELNHESIGVELCNRADRWKDKDYYARHGINRPVKACKINGHVIDSFDFTKEQYEQMVLLGRALRRLLPNIPAEFPQSSPGQVMLDTIGYPALDKFSGYIGHYHLTTNKWDPGPWDFRDFLQKVRGSFSWPAWPRGAPPVQVDQTAPPPPPAVPSDTNEVRRDAQQLNAANEQRADGGFYPVGPWGESRLWHGGIHLATIDNAPIYAPFPGRLVAARMGAESAVGSLNFVLLRHDIRLSDKRLEFFTLNMHLADEMTSATQPLWLKKYLADGKRAAGAVWRLDEAVEAGAIIGHAGRAGPPDARRSQIHLELFANEDLLAGVRGSPFETLDGTTGGRFCELSRIDELIDTNKDRALSRDELRTFFTSGQGEAFHNLAIRHVSEWYADPDWAATLRQHPRDLPKLTGAQIDRMVAEQITPGLWWDDDVSAHCRLQYDGVVYHYHPIRFIRWLNEKLIEAANAAPTIDARAAGKVPDGVTDDRDGIGMAAEDRFDAPKVDVCNEKLGLKEMTQGFDAPTCKP